MPKYTYTKEVVNCIFCSKEWLCNNGNRSKKFLWLISYRTTCIINKYNTICKDSKRISTDFPKDKLLIKRVIESNKYLKEN